LYFCPPKLVGLSTELFVVDNMLLKLAKYLRNMGFDCEYVKESDKEKLLKVA